MSKRYVYRPGHPLASVNGFVDVEDLGAWQEGEQLALNAPICVDRFYEGASYVDGEGNKIDLGSRRRHREFMKEKGFTTIDDYKQTWQDAEKQRARFYQGDFDHKERREMIGRTLYQMERKRGP